MNYIFFMLTGLFFDIMAAVVQIENEFKYILDNLYRVGAVNRGPHTHLNRRIAGLLGPKGQFIFRCASLI